MKLVWISLLLSSQAIFAASNPLFGVYRGVVSSKQSCTMSILEQKENQVVSIIIDQNPFIFVSSSEIIAMLSQQVLKMKLVSIDSASSDTAEIEIDSKTKKIEVTTNAGGVTAKCSKAFQIRPQD